MEVVCSCDLNAYRLQEAELGLGALAFGNVVDDRVVQGSATSFQQTGMDLYVADRARRQSMPKKEIVAAFVGRSIDLLGPLGPCGGIYVGEGHAPQSLEAVTIEFGGCRVCIDDRARFAIDQQLNGAVLFEHLAIAPLARAQLAGRESSPGSLKQQKCD